MANGGKRDVDLNPNPTPWTLSLNLTLTQEGAVEELQEMRGMRQRAVAQLRAGGGAPSTDAEEEAAEVLAELKAAQARLLI